jgi:hypothetical protein
MLIIKIADKHYRIALSAYQMRDYEKTISHASTAKELYIKVGSLNASYNAAELIDRASSSGDTDIIEPTQEDYTIILIIVIILLVAAIIIVRLRRSGPVRSKRAPTKRDIVDDELEQLEQMEGEFK